MTTSWKKKRKEKKEEEEEEAGEENYKAHPDHYLWKAVDMV